MCDGVPCWLILHSKQPQTKCGGVMTRRFHNTLVSFITLLLSVYLHSTTQNQQNHKWSNMDPLCHGEVCVFRFSVFVHNCDLQCVICSVRGESFSCSVSLSNDQHDEVIFLYSLAFLLSLQIIHFCWFNSFLTLLPHFINFINVVLAAAHESNQMIRIRMLNWQCFHINLLLTTDNVHVFMTFNDLIYWDVGWSVNSLSTCEVFRYEQ